MIFVVLLAVAAVVGRFIVPAGGPERGASPAASAGRVEFRDAAAQRHATAAGLAAAAHAPAPAGRRARAVGRNGSADMINVPEVAIQAYGYAQLMLQQTDPQCHLSWTTLAGIAQVESTHGQAGGAVLEPSGRSSPPIAGPLLDGRNGRPLVRDTDAGAFDGDATYDRAMGPLRLAAQRLAGPGDRRRRRRDPRSVRHR